MKVAVIGLGNLGLPLAVAMAKRGVQVFGVERDSERLRRIREADSSLEEPGVRPQLKKLFRSRHFLLCDLNEAVSQSEAALIAVNTPEHTPGEMDTGDLEISIREVASILRSQSRFYVVSVASTLVPGTTEGKLRPLLEKASGKKVGTSVGLAVNPVFIALGSVIRDYLNPPMVVVGASDPKTSRWLVNFYKRVCKNSPPVLTCSPYMAEVVKLAHNAYCTSKMAFINEIAELCARVPEGDIRKVEEFFSRGGERQGQFLKAGLGFGGPCFPRDLRFFVNYLEEQGLRPRLLKAIGESNKAHAYELVRQIRDRVGSLKGKRVALVGLSYKPGVRNFEDSFSLRLIEELNLEKARVWAYDPLLLRNGIQKVQKGDSPLKRGQSPFNLQARAKFVLKKTFSQALKDADVCILAQKGQKGNSPLPRGQSPKKGTVPFYVFDPWGVLSK